ncbi:MAG TPA: M20/M25/M40 family metallo-hydrolase [Gemmatimonadales bacterium]|nr:M20/M25/M40 family metallo-hydrolase [Gemmatimonadales bacterium]
MPGHPLVVLKFGSSVLGTERDYAAAVAGIQRHLQRGERVLAVVSALKGATDRLLADAHFFGPKPEPAATASLLATGESASAARLALALDAAGVEAALLDPGAIGLTTHGPLLDADPVAVNADAVRRALEHSGAAVVAGFYGRDSAGGYALFGRGGSDLTALFLAHRLGAKSCRLVKDVEGVYERDPGAGGRAPRRYELLSWEDALKLGSRVVQPKTLHFARRERIEFEVGRVGSPVCTRIGPGPSTWAQPRGAKRRAAKAKAGTPSRRRTAPPDVEVCALTRSLVDIPSVSGDEGEISAFVASCLERLGYRVELQEAAPGRSNVIARTTTPPRVVLASHLDTVPPFFPSSEDADHVFGRGACDAKGIVAAQIAAAERLRAEGHKGIGLLYVVDEEAGSLGAKVANGHAAASGVRYVVVGEPTENRLATGCMGSLRLSLATAGIAAHSAYPERGSSAILALLDVLADIRAVEWPADPFFGVTTCNIGTIAGGSRANVVPAEAQTELHFRLSIPSAGVLQRLQEVVRGRASIEVHTVTEPVRLTELPDFDSCVVRYTTDAPHLSRWGAPLVLGPGSILEAHTEREKVPKAELRVAVAEFARLARALLERSAVEVRT